MLEQCMRAIALDRHPSSRSLHPGRPWLVLGLLAGGAAAALFWSRQARRSELRNPPAGKFVEVQGVRLHYLEHGHGRQPIVLLHGNMVMAEDFELSGVVERLAARHRVIAFDRPGFGYSSRPKGRIWGPDAQAGLLLEAFEKLGLRRPVVVGHSWGALVALAMGLLRPDALRSLVLISGYYRPTVRLDVPILAAPGLPVVGTVLRWTLSPALARLFLPLLAWRLFAPGPGARRFLNQFPHDLALRPRQIGASGAESALMIPVALAYRRRQRRLRLPTLVVAGSGDRHVNAHRQSAALARRLPRASLHLLPGAGHMVHHQAPGKVAALIDLATTMP
jgi:pimeloyl-ACP methyl ester carboxylesterase